MCSCVEHVNNCGQFRAVKEIPLPFIISEVQTPDALQRANAAVEDFNDEDMVVVEMSPIEAR